MLDKTTKLIQQTVSILERQIELIESKSELPLENSEVIALNNYIKSLLAIHKEWTEEVKHQLNEVNSLDIDEMEKQLKQAIKNIEKEKAKSKKEK